MLIMYYNLNATVEITSGSYFQKIGTVFFEVFMKYLQIPKLFSYDKHCIICL